MKCARRRSANSRHCRAISPGSQTSTFLDMTAATNSRWRMTRFDQLLRGTNATRAAQTIDSARAQGVAQRRSAQPQSWKWANRPVENWNPTAPSRLSRESGIDSASRSTQWRRWYYSGIFSARLQQRQYRTLKLSLGAAFRTSILPHASGSVDPCEAAYILFDLLQHHSD